MQPIIADCGVKSGMIYVLSNNPILLIQISVLSGIVENYSFLYLADTSGSDIVPYSMGLNL